MLLIQHKRCHHLGNNGSGAGSILGGKCLFQTRIAQGKHGNARIVERQIITVRLYDADSNGSHCLHIVLFQFKRTFDQPCDAVFLAVSLQCKAVAHDVFGKILTLVAPSPQPSIAHNASASPPSAYCNTSRPACNSYSASPPSTSRSAVCSLPVICGYGRAWRYLCGAHVKQRLPENRFTDFQAASRLSRFQAFAIVGFQTTPHNRWQATATRLPAK